MAYDKTKRKYEEVMEQAKIFLEEKQMIALPGGTWCTLCKTEICRNLAHSDRQKLNLLISMMAEQIGDLNKKYENLYFIARALEDFKLKCYQRLNKDKEYDNFIMNNAPCNYDLERLK